MSLKTVKQDILIIITNIATTLIIFGYFFHSVGRVNVKMVDVIFISVVIAVQAGLIKYISQAKR